MKFSESWLREWVNPPLTREALCDALTMAGLEVEEIKPVSLRFTNIVVGQIKKIQKHPQADLQICSVDIGDPKFLQIVCGAKKIVLNSKVAVAKNGAVLPDETIIRDSEIKGFSSNGMICSPSELDLSDETENLFVLPDDAKIGEDLWTYLQLADYVIDVSITPNRGDCLSIEGMARETAAIMQSPLHKMTVKVAKVTSKDALQVQIEDKIGCPKYLGRVIKNVKADATSPTWLKERLRRSGIRSISPVVDVTNYVMLELGQPMHAFDLAKINKKIIVRKSSKGEEIALLDGSKQTLDNDTMVIADEVNVLAIAGVMGGLDSSVTLLTQDIFLESAYFSPTVVARQRQFYGLNSESAYRFERNIDPGIQLNAIERATQLILEISSGEPGPITSQVNENALPKTNIITLAKNKIDEVLGVIIPLDEIVSILKRLNFGIKKISGETLEVNVPPFRADITLPEDLIEEIARLYGYEKIPSHQIAASLILNSSLNTEQDISNLRETLTNLGYHEIISYSFTDKKLEDLLDPERTPLMLVNPISSEMAAMRTSLWPGLMNALHYNKSRQQQRIRIFEIGTCFITHDNQLTHQSNLSGLITGDVTPAQWGNPAREVDFFDLKGDVEHLLKSVLPKDKLFFKPDVHPALHPGQTAAVYFQDQKIGILGRLHPSLEQKLDLNSRVFLFELQLKMINKLQRPHYKEISKFPEIRRDLALLINEAIPAKDIQDRIRESAGDWLKDVFIFDVYQGKGVSPGLKSIAVALILQHATRTLVDDEVTELMERVITALQGQLGAELRR